jgi:hypothetical protein
MGIGELHYQAREAIDGYWDEDEDRFVCEDDHCFVDADGLTIRLQPWAKIVMEIREAKLSLRLRDESDQYWHRHRSLLLDSFSQKRASVLTDPTLISLTAQCPAYS